MLENTDKKRATRSFSTVRFVEHAAIGGRRRQALRKQLQDPMLDTTIEQLPVAPATVLALQKAITDYRAAVESGSEPADTDQDPILIFQGSIDALIAGLPGEKKKQVKALFVRVQHDADTPPETVGLALSGGGIRSAAFNLGVLQALKNKRFFPRIDYLSTVSGGGYIGSSLTYFMQRETGESFPFDETDNGLQRAAWIRRHACYLSPGDGLNLWALGAAAMRGILINLFFLIPLWLLLVWVLTLGVSHTPRPVWPAQVLDGLAKLWPVVLTMLLAMLSVSFIRQRLNTRRWNQAARAIEDWGMRSVLWALAIATAFMLNSNELLKPWSAYPWYLKAAPAFILIAVFLASKMVSGTRARQRFIEVMELAAWGIVFCTLYALVPIPLLSFDLLRQVQYPPVFILIFLIGIILILKLLVNYLFFAILSTSQSRLEYSSHRYFSVQYGDLLFIGVACMLVGLIPIVDYFLIDQGVLKQTSRQVLASMSLGGVLSTVFGWIGRKKTDERRGLVAFLLRTGLVLLITVAVLATYRWAVGAHTGAGETHWLLPATWGLVFLIFAGNSDINYVSMHRYYRNRLLEAFLMDKEQDTDSQPATDTKSDNLDLCNINIATTGAPYHLINTNLITVGSCDNKLRLRGGDSFIFSPQFIGSEATGWVPADHPYFSGMNLATALAISGAAVDPNTGVSRSWPLRIFMTWLNVRLGYWYQNPNGRYCALGWVNDYVHSSWLWLVIKEMFGAAQEKWSYVHLSDGGHFENLGAYELFRRKCNLIIVSDAGADPRYTFSDLALAIERARVDFRVHVTGLDTENIQPERFKCKDAQKNADCAEPRLSKTPFSVGKIRYSDGTQGLLIYVKTTLFHGLSEDVLGYARQHQSFPDESTANQFFTEEQFEAYRELGYRSMALAIDTTAEAV